MPLETIEASNATLSTVLDQRTRVIEEAETWIGTPFQMNACLKGQGVDCSRFLYACYWAVGLRLRNKLEDFPHLPSDWGLHAREEHLLNILQHNLRFVDTPEKGDLAVFRIGRAFSHAALVVSWPDSVIHLYSRGVCAYASANHSPLVGRIVIFMSPWS